MKKFCLFLMTCVLVLLALLSTGCSVDDGVSAPDRICYGKKLYYEDVCGGYNIPIGPSISESEYDSIVAYYNGLCARWKEGGYDSFTGRYDPDYYITTETERVCLEDVTFE